MITIATRATKELNLDLSRKWGFPAAVLADATCGLGITMMLETGRTEEQIVEIVRRLANDMAIAKQGWTP
jgi:hypothetical protein